MFYKNRFNFLYVQTHLRHLLSEKPGHKPGHKPGQQKEVVLKTFKKQLLSDTIITGKKMQNFISITLCLANRTIPQMRTWLHA